MTRINRVRRLAASLRPTTFACAASSRTPFLTTTRRTLSITSSLRADEPPVQQNDDLSEIETPTGPASEPTTRLRLPPKQTIADTEAEITASDPTYTPATSVSDLEPLPLLRNWWSQPGHWSSESNFSGFGLTAKERITDGNLVRVMLKRAVLEVLALQQTGQYDALKFKRWALGGRQEMERAMKGELTVDEAELVVRSLTEESEAAAAEESGEAVMPTAGEAKAAVKAWGSDWMSLPLNDETKFVIRKRLYQLTGTLLPDARLAAARTVGDLAALASIAPKPKKLFHQLHAQAKTLPPNIKIHPRRITPIDKEKSVGRWKVIEAELKKRELPVTGYGNAAGHKERVWLTGRR